MDPEINLLSSILENRGVEEVHVFHTDHWEPWYDGKTDYHLERIVKFLDRMERHPHSRNLTLFYKAVLAHLPRTSETHIRGDRISSGRWGDFPSTNQDVDGRNQASHERHSGRFRTRNPTPCPP